MGLQYFRFWFGFRRKINTFKFKYFVFFEKFQLVTLKLKYESFKIIKFLNISIFSIFSKIKYKWAEILNNLPKGTLYRLRSVGAEDKRSHFGSSGSATLATASSTILAGILVERRFSNPGLHDCRLVRLFWINQSINDHKKGLFCTDLGFID